MDTENRLIRHDELPTWVPGEVLASADALRWNGVNFRAYLYEGQACEVPPMADFMIVSFKRGVTSMERRFDGRWNKTECHPGDCSLMTRSQMSSWHWANQIEVKHAYLSNQLVTRVAVDMLERPVTDIRLHDLLKVRDPVITSIIDSIAAETSDQAMGGHLYVDALATQLVVHMLRRYTQVTYRESAGSGRFSPAMARQLLDVIESRLHEGLSLEALAEVANVGVWTFGRRFRDTFGQTPHAFILKARVQRAERLLAQDVLPVKVVASDCGFSDQAHMTRVLRAHLGRTPAALRRSSSTDPQTYP